MKKIAILLLVTLLLTGCGSSQQNQSAGEERAYMNITAEEAKKLMDTEQDYVILDVRTREEYESGHIPGALLIPDTEIDERAENELKNKDQLILVYCRSGNRSKTASEKLEKLGYTRIREFGGIKDWPYEIE